VKVKHLIDSRNKQAKKTFSMTIARKKSRISYCWKKWLLEINVHKHIYMIWLLVMQAETNVLF